MAFLNGWRTIVTALLALLWAGLDAIGVAVPLADQEAVAVGLLAAIMIVLRIFTRGPTPLAKMLDKRDLHMILIPVAFLLAASPVMLSGCGTISRIATGGEYKFDTLNKQIVLAAAQLQTAANVTVELIRLNLITGETADKIQSHLNDGHAALMIAFEAAQRGDDPNTATTALDAATKAAALALEIISDVGLDSSPMSHLSDNAKRAVFGFSASGGN